MNTKNLFVCFACFALGGCLLTTKPIEIGKDTYSITSTADGLRTGTAARGKALIRGQEKCESLGKKFLLVSEDTKRTRMGIDTTVSVTFRCLSENDPEYTR